MWPFSRRWTPESERERGTVAANELLAEKPSPFTIDQNYSAAEMDKELSCHRGPHFAIGLARRYTRLRRRSCGHVGHDEYWAEWEKIRQAYEDRSCTQKECAQLWSALKLQADEKFWTYKVREKYKKMLAQVGGNPPV